MLLLYFFCFLIFSVSCYSTVSPDIVKTRIFNGCENYEEILGITVEFPPEFKRFRRPWIEEFKNISLFSSEALTYNWIWLKELQIKGLKTTFAEFLNLLEKNNCLFITYGESTKDIFLGSIKETSLLKIEGESTCNVSKIYEICRRKFGIYKCGLRPTKEYDRVTFGVPDDNDRLLHSMIDPIIVGSWNSTFNRPKTHWDFTANAVGIYDNTAGKVLLVDMTGRALRDICQHVIDVPVVQDNWPLWASGNLVKILRYYNLVADQFYGGKDVREFIMREVKKNFNKTQFQEYYCRFVLDGVFILNSEGDTVTSNCYSNHPDYRRKRIMKFINNSMIQDFGEFWKKEMLPEIQNLNIILFSHLTFEIQRTSQSSWPSYEPQKFENFEDKVTNERENEFKEITSKVIFTQKEYELKTENSRQFTSTQVYSSETPTTKRDFNFEVSTKDVDEIPRIPETESPLVAQSMEDYDIEGDIHSQKSEDYTPYGVD